MEEHIHIVNVISKFWESSQRYSKAQVFKDKKVVGLEKYKPDVRGITKNSKTDVCEVWLGEAWEKAVTDLLFCLSLKNLRRIYIVPVKMHHKYENEPDRIWKKQDVFSIRKFLTPLLKKKMQKSLSRMKVLEIDEDELKGDKWTSGFKKEFGAR